MVRADCLLTYASMKMAEKRLLELVKSYGKETVLEACNEIVKPDGGIGEEGHFDVAGGYLPGRTGCGLGRNRG